MKATLAEDRLAWTGQQARLLRAGTVVEVTGIDDMGRLTARHGFAVLNLTVDQAVVMEA